MYTSDILYILSIYVVIRSTVLSHLYLFRIICNLCMRSDPWYTRSSGRPHDDNDTLRISWQFFASSPIKFAEEIWIPDSRYGILAERGNSRWSSLLVEIFHIILFRRDKFLFDYSRIKWDKKNRQSNSLLVNLNYRILSN